MAKFVKFHPAVVILAVLVVLFVRSDVAPRGGVLAPAPLLFFTARDEGYYTLFVKEGGRVTRLFSSGDLLRTRPGFARYHITFDVSGDGRFVAYSALSDGGNMDIFLLDRKTGKRKNLTRSENVDTLPVFSTDGTRIAYLSHEPAGRRYDYIVLISRDGRYSRRLTSEFFRVYSLAFSPDDRQILFTWKAFMRSVVSLLDLDTGAIRDLTPLSCSSMTPSFSRDGSMIVYVSDCRGTRDIWTTDREGKSRSLLYEGPGDDYDPHFTGEGSVVFLSEGGGEGSEGGNSIVAIGLAGGDPVILLRPSGSHRGEFHSFLAVQGEGGRISFQTRHVGERGGSETVVSLMDMESLQEWEIHRLRTVMFPRVLFP
jgi:Tol biopolymer transport system component